MPARQHLLQIQQNLYHRFQSSARQSAGNLPPQLRRYFQEYQRDLTDYKSLSSREELLDAFIKADILICGDYHTLPQAQRTALWLLSGAAAGLKEAKRPVLALEMLQEEDGPATRQFLEGALTESAYLKAIGYQKNWGFNWENYRPLFALAKSLGIEIIGLRQKRSRQTPLAQRDRFAAEALFAFKRLKPSTSVLVLMGDLHLAKQHLPRQIARCWKGQAQPRLVTVHQNAETLYWKLVRRGHEHDAEVVKVRKNVYCVMNTPPWVKLQSYLHWLEEVASEDTEGESAWETVDYSENFKELVDSIGLFLGLEKPIEDSFSLVWSGDDRIFEGSTSLRRIREAILQAVGSYFIPSRKQVILTLPGVNAASTQAAIFLHSHLSHRKREFELPRQDFFQAIWVEALGFLGSKVIHPQRRCYGPADFADAVKYKPVGPAQKNQHRLAAQVDSALRAERAYWQSPTRFVGISLPVRVGAEKAAFYYRVARCLGQILGSALYTAVIKRRVSQTALRELFENSFDEKKQAKALYLQWAQQLDKWGLRERIRRAI